jgi:hypothetical protein
LRLSVERSFYSWLSWPLSGLLLNTAGSSISLAGLLSYRHLCSSQARSRVLSRRRIFKQALRRIGTSCGSSCHRHFKLAMIKRRLSCLYKYVDIYVYIYISSSVMISMYTRDWHYIYIDIDMGLYGERIKYSWDGSGMYVFECVCQSLSRELLISGYSVMIIVWTVK